jgi:hypothetical protein
MATPERVIKQSEPITVAILQKKCKSIPLFRVDFTDLTRIPTEVYRVYDSEGMRVGYAYKVESMESSR